MIKELVNIPDNFVIMQINSGAHGTGNLTILKHLVNKQRMSGAYVSLGREITELKKNINRFNIRSNKLNFIACNQSSKDPGIIILPNDLMSLCFALDRTLDDKEQKFVVLDSLNDMLKHNDYPTVMAFLFFLVGKVKLFNKKAVVFATDSKEHAHDIATLSQMFDKVLTVL